MGGFGKKFALATLGVLLLSSAPTVVSAASLYIDPPNLSLKRGEVAVLAVRLDTDEATGECVNAVDGVITYPENMSIDDISIGSSILPIWVEQPIIDQEKRQITFAGGIPNGYCGRVAGDPQLTNHLLELVVRSPGFTVGGTDETTARIEFAPETQVFRNDGQGTLASLQTFGSTIRLSQQLGNNVDSTWQDAVDADTIPPEDFSIRLERNRNAFGNEYYIVFNTTDKQTGIDQYQVMEEPISQLGSFSWGRADAPWVTAQSPYELKDQSLNSVIRVRALDKAGNEYIATLIPDESLRTMSTEMKVLMGIAAGIGVLLVLIIGTVLWYVRRQNRRNSDKSEEEAGRDTLDAKDETDGERDRDDDLDTDSDATQDARRT